MSSWGGSSSFIPKIGCSKKVVSLSKSKTTLSKEEPIETLKISLHDLPEVFSKLIDLFGQKLNFFILKIRLKEKERVVWKNHFTFYNKSSKNKVI